MNKYVESFLAIFIVCLCFCIGISPIIIGAIYNLNIAFVLLLLITMPIAAVVHEFLMDKIDREW